MRKVLSVALTALAVFTLQAQSLPVLLLQTDPAVAGSAGASSQSAVSAYAAENNMAAVSLSSDKLHAGVSYESWQPAAAKDRLLGFGAFWHSGKLGLAVGFKSLQMPSYEIVSPNGATSQVDGAFSPGESSISLGGSYALGKNLAFGVVARLTSSNLAKDASASVFGADISVQYSTDGLSAGLTLANLGGKVDYGEGPYPQPACIKAGASYDIIEGLNVSAGAGYLFEGAFESSVGAEYSFMGMAFGRAGYHLGSRELGIPSYASVGAGGKVAGVSLDVAYLFASDTVGGSFIAGLSYAF
jgi:hypothetical protein